MIIIQKIEYVYNFYMLTIGVSFNISIVWLAKQEIVL